MTMQKTCILTSSQLPAFFGCVHDGIASAIPPGTSGTSGYSTTSRGIDRIPAVDFDRFWGDVTLGRGFLTGVATAGDFVRPRFGVDATVECECGIVELGDFALAGTLDPEEEEAVTVCKGADTVRFAGVGVARGIWDSGSKRDLELLALAFVPARAPFDLRTEVFGNGACSACLRNSLA